MTTQRVSTVLSVSLLSLTILSMANCGDDSTPTTTLGGASSSSSSSSSSGEGGSGGGKCMTDTDCPLPNSICEQGACIQQGCVNGMKDGTETDVDCGGGSCLPCANDKECMVADDCGSKYCNGPAGMAGTCAACATEMDCSGATGTYCDTTAGTCLPKKAGAATCGADAECQSGFCPPQDKLCCDTRCDSTCEACAAAKTGGADGTCAPVTADMDPDVECVDQGTASCGANGTGCNGNMSAPACKLYNNTTTCAPASCTAGEAKMPSICDGSGTCVAPTPTSCSPYLCDAAGAMCLTSCQNNAQCVSTHYCDMAMSKCVPKKTNGTTCANGAQCTSGFCPTQDGVCCDTACDTLCRACVQMKTGSATGTCGNVTAGSDPDNECSGITTPNCNGAGVCSL
ncbi:MAG TPA: hypothetical protein PK156_32885 [Polyangium sp.]|nr:hypothetical protein [Polyangium sp.]